MSNSNNSSSGGIGFFGFLSLLFIALKLTNVIDWSWIWVLSPIWGPTAILILVIIVLFIWGIIESNSKRKKFNQKMKVLSGGDFIERKSHFMQRLEEAMKKKKDAGNNN